MKKKIGFIVLTIVFLTLCACSVSKTDIDTEQSNNKQDEETQEMFTESEEGTADNPIDVEYLKLEYDGSTTLYIEELNKFEKYWWDEMNYAIEVLQPLLDEEDGIALVEAQEGWESYYIENKKMQTSFYKDYKYEVIGNMYWMFAANDNVEKVRNRTLEIIDYISATGNEYTFKFNAKTDVLIDIYDLESPGTEAAIFTAMTSDLSLGEINATFHIEEYAKIEILEKEAILYQIFYENNCVGYITNEFLDNYDFYYSSMDLNEQMLYRCDNTTKGWYIDYETIEEYVIIEYIQE